MDIDIQIKEAEKHLNELRERKNMARNQMLAQAFAAGIERNKCSKYHFSDEDYDLTLLTLRSDVSVTREVGVTLVTYVERTITVNTYPNSTGNMHCSKDTRVTRFNDERQYGDPCLGSDELTTEFDPVLFEIKWNAAMAAITTIV
jgi:hypothetical protein